MTKGRWGDSFTPSSLHAPNDNKRPLTPKSMPPTGDEHTKLKSLGPQKQKKKKKAEQERKL